MRLDLPLVTKEFAALRPAGGFRVILADFPWEFEHWSEKGQGKAAQAHYDVLSIEEIITLPLSALAADNCAFFMWVTWPLAMRWKEVVEGLGFTYAGLAWEWIKFNPKTHKYAFGGGYGTRKNVEPCLLCVRGDPQLKKPITSDMLGPAVVPAGVRSVRDFIEAMPLDAIRAPRTRIHSQKPDEQYERIETMFDGPYIELFSRKDRPGWSSWGNETGKFNEAKQQENINGEAWKAPRLEEQEERTGA